MEKETKGQKLYRDLLENHAATFEDRAGPLSNDEKSDMFDFLTVWHDILESSSAAKDEDILKVVIATADPDKYPTTSTRKGEHLQALVDYHIIMTKSTKTPHCLKLMPYPWYAPHFASKLGYKRFKQLILNVCVPPIGEISSPESNKDARRYMDLARADKYIIEPHNALKKFLCSELKNVCSIAATAFRKFMAENSGKRMKDFCTEFEPRFLEKFVDDISGRGVSIEAAVLLFRQEFDLLFTE